LFSDIPTPDHIDSRPKELIEVPIIFRKVNDLI
jgi:hypothetical protein